MSPNTVRAADQPVLSTMLIVYCYAIRICSLKLPSSVIMTFTAVDGDLALMLLRNASITSPDS